MWELDCEESWVLKNWCFWIVVLEKTLESPLDCKEIQPVHSKGDQPWVFFGRTDAKAEALVLWPPHAKSWLIGKDSDAGRDWGQEEKGMTEDEMAGWHHRLDRCEFEWTLGIGDGQGGLVCCNLWGHKESDMTERLNWTDDYSKIVYFKSVNSMVLNYISIKSLKKKKKTIKFPLCMLGVFQDSELPSIEKKIWVARGHHFRRKSKPYGEAMDKCCIWQPTSPPNCQTASGERSQIWGPAGLSFQMTAASVDISVKAQERFQARTVQSSPF